MNRREFLKMIGGAAGAAVLATQFGGRIPDAVAKPLRMVLDTGPLESGKKYTFSVTLKLNPRDSWKVYRKTVTAIDGQRQMVIDLFDLVANNDSVTDYGGASPDGEGKHVQYANSWQMYHAGLYESPEPIPYSPTLAVESGKTNHALRSNDFIASKRGGYARA